MDGTQLLFGAVIGGIMGFFCGMIPSKAAMARNQTTFAGMSVAICVIVGLVGGCLLALPAAFILKLIVVGMGEKHIPMHASGVSMADYDATRRDVRRDGFVDDPFKTRDPYTVVGPAIVCNECRNACSKVDGKPPARCPNCDEVFVSIPVVRVAKPAAKPSRPVASGDFVELL